MEYFRAVNDGGWVEVTARDRDRSVNSLAAPNGDALADRVGFCSQASHADRQFLSMVKKTMAEMGLTPQLAERAVVETSEGLAAWEAARRESFKRG